MRWNEESWRDVADTLGFNSEEEMLRHLYTIQKFSINQISRIVGYTSFSVRRRLLMLSVVLRGRGGPNGQGKRALLHLSDAELWGESAEKLAIKLQCHPSTVYAEKRFRDKNARLEKEKILNALLPAVPSGADPRDGGVHEEPGGQRDLAHGVGSTSKLPSLLGSDEEQTRNGGESNT